MKKLFLSAALAVLAGTPVLAGVSGHGDGHGAHSSHGEQMAAGVPGKLSEVSRTVKVAMEETDDGDMIFTPSAMEFKQGETIRIMVVNEGELDHEFVLDTPERNAMHKQAMAGGMEQHNTPNAVTLAPGKRGEVIWNFSNGGTFEFACLIPGHYESGMYGQVTVQ
ncbi:MULTISPECIES: cupredoxin domain-containing protein [unclassified Leisingera]|uniref:cupredoxin domain-containing protein n=1 Tax=unclassified Leisingera TaxID=2614906 RepID=UPI00057E281F|nr:cupredoxin family protein [Leisingera sp. ANG-M6]KIC27083.1 copper oxidase [Leisingera sp. ANG-M6]OED47269.1 copper oxidase [Rhodobacteraceae bacterium (ex Bugula neritina AB1)]